MLIDVHNHYYPPPFLAALRADPGVLRVETGPDGNPWLYSPGDINVAVPGHRDIAHREAMLEREGVDRQVITLTCPGTTLEAPARSAALASMVNDALAAVVAGRGHRFSALATLPLNDPAASVREFERAMGLGFKGCMLFGSVNKVPLSDRRYWPLYERASEAQAVFMIHPNFPPGVEQMEEYWLMPLVGFLMDTTLAAAGLVFSGVVERYPGIRWILGHLGGTIPYLVERLDRGYEAFPECRANLTQPPSAHLKRFFYDTVNFDPKALRLAVDFAGASQILAGSDYPHMIGSIPKMKAALAALKVSEAERAMILGGNAMRLLGLGPDGG